LCCARQSGCRGSLRRSEYRRRGADTLVYYCYTILNTGEAPLSLHTLADSEIGPVLANLDYVLAPGATVDTVTLGRVLSET
jgi:hypothetical protein